VIYALLAAVAWSTAGILQRQLHVNAATQVAGRGVFGFIALAGYAAYTQPQALASVTKRGALLAASVTGRCALLAAGAMAVANSAFIVSLNHTSVAHVLVLQSIAPLVAAGLGVVVLGERLTWRTACAMAVALAGVVVMVGAPAEMAMIFLLEVVLGPLWTWIALSETPNVVTLAGGAAVILGVGAQVGGFGERKGRPAASDAGQPQRLGNGRPARSGTRRPFVLGVTFCRRPGGRAPGSARCGGRRPGGPGTRTRRQRPRPRRRSRTTAGAGRRRRSRRHLPRLR
jgi:uncharacterized membrane protein